MAGRGLQSGPVFGYAPKTKIEAEKEGQTGRTPEPTPKSRRKLRPSAQSATTEAADAGANTAIENAAEGDDTRTAAATKRRRKDSPSSKTEVRDKVPVTKRGSTKR
ncbi:hypothetical protein DIPPA_08529 [Diplonema papillatum]|nr:hypothetical protein DIPPA_08529 [Diplonema papillatum]